MSMDYQDKKCPVCGKIFIPYTPYWQYKVNDEHGNRFKVCSYTCQQNYKQEKQNRAKEKMKNGKGKRD